MKKVMLGAIALYAFALPFSAASNAAIIDSFDTDQEVIDDTVGGGGVWGSVNSGAGDILGGERDAFAQILSGAAGTPAARIDVSGSVASFDVDSSGNSNFALQYDGDDADGEDEVLTPDGLGSVDLSFGNAFVFEVLAADQPGLQVSATVWSGGGLNSSTVNIGSTFPVDNPGLPGNVDAPFFADILFSEFGDDVDFSDVSALEFTLSGNVAFDVSVANIETRDDIPEPMTLGLVGAGLLTMGVVTARRRRA